MKTKKTLYRPCCDLTPTGVTERHTISRVKWRIIAVTRERPRVLSQGLLPITRAVITQTRPKLNGLPRRPLPTTRSQLDSDLQHGHFLCGHKRLAPRLPQDTTQAGVPVRGSVPSRPLPQRWRQAAPPARSALRRRLPPTQQSPRGRHRPAAAAPNPRTT